MGSKFSTKDVELYKNIAEQIRITRENLNMKQWELAEKADITSAYLSQIEGNKKIPSLPLIRRIYEILDIPVLVFNHSSYAYNYSPLVLEQLNKAASLLNEATAKMKLSKNKLQE